MTSFRYLRTVYLPRHSNTTTCYGRRFSSGNSFDVEIKTTPRVCMHDVPTSVQVLGLDPMKPFTLTSYAKDDRDNEYGTSALYFADSSGRIDLARNISVGGAFKGVFPSGLLTTLRPINKTPPYTRFLKTNTTVPWRVHIKVFDGHKQAISESDTPLATAVLERHFMAPGVRRIPIRGHRIRGVMYLPSGDNLNPGIIDTYGFVNGIIEHRSALLASRGIASLCLPLFGYEDLPISPGSFDIEYMEEAVDVLVKQENVISDRCGILSTCFSSTFGNLLGMNNDLVKAVISANGPPMLSGGVDIYKNNKLLYKAITNEGAFITDDNGVIKGHPENHTRKDFPVLPVKLVPDTHFLFVCGEDDQIFGHQLINLLLHEFEAIGSHNYRKIIYEGAGHTMEPPNFPVQRILCLGFQPGAGKRVEHLIGLGGEPSAMASAQEKFWFEILQFINCHIRDGSDQYQNWMKQSR